MTMNPTPRKTDDDSQRAIDEFLAKGGKIQQCNAFERSEELNFTGGFYGRKPKKKEEGPAE
jgi:hypothetical protein